jgi:hypothetical protein
MSWSAALKEPVPLPEGGALETLHDIRTHVLNLPETERDEEAWHTVAETLLNAADQGGPWMDFARIATMQALYRNIGPRYGPGKSVSATTKFCRYRRARRR